MSSDDRNDIDLICTYCGVPADSEDHVVPRHLLARAGELEMDLSQVMRMQTWVVPACRECNSIIGGQLFATIKERRECAHKGIRKKYASYLRVPNWSEEDLEEMGPDAQREIIAAIKVRDWVKTRLRWKGAKKAEIVDLRGVFALSQSMARKQQSKPAEEAA